MGDFLNKSDEDLLESYAQGEAEAFEAFFLRHRGRVYQYALKMVQQPEIATELCQDVFLKLHAKIHLYKIHSPALPWFFSIVHNTCLDSLRKSGRDNVLQNALKAESSEMIAEPTRHQIQATEMEQGESSFNDEAYRKAVRELSPEQRMVLDGRIFKDKSFTDLAEQSGKPEVTLRKIYSRAIHKLRIILGAGEQGGGK